MSFRFLARRWGILSRMKLRLAVLLSSLALVAASCGGDDSGDKDKTKEGDSQPVVQMSPLTGAELPDGPPANPVFVVKVENTRAGSPQYGLNQAEVVVEQMVEGGVTRLAAMYYTALPNKIGHVRSMRATDVGIAAPVAGQIVASGGAGATYDVVAANGLTVFAEDKGAPGFSSDPSKSRPYNRLLDLAALAGSATAGEMPGPYFEFTKPVEEGAEPPAPPAGARPVTSASITFSRSHTTTLALGEGGWSRTNGFAAAGEEFVAPNLVVVFAPVVDAGYKDPGGNSVPETKFEGTGRGLVVIGGQAVDVTWTKEGPGGTLKFVDANGAPVTMPVGKTWIQLAPESGSVAVQ